MPTKRPLGFTALALFIVWLAYQSIFDLFRSKTVESEILGLYNLTAVHHIALIGMIVLGLPFAYAIWKRRKFALRLYSWFFEINVAYLLLAIIVTSIGGEQVGNILVEDQLNRGYSNQRAELFGNPMILIGSEVVLLLLFLYFWKYTKKYKAYFETI